MPALLFAAILSIMLGLADAGYAQVRWSRSEMKIVTEQCFIDTTVDLWLVNPDDEPVVIQYVTGAFEYPDGWRTDTMNTLAGRDSLLFTYRFYVGGNQNSNSYKVEVTAVPYFLPVPGEYPTFTLSVERHAPLLRITPGSVGFNLAVGETMSDTVLIENHGTREFIFDLFTSIGGDLWTISGVKQGDTLFAGSSVGVIVSVTPQWERFFSGMTELSNGCISGRITYNANTRIEGIKIGGYRTNMTISGCARPTSHDIAIVNTLDKPMQLDSVKMIGQTGGWTFAAAPPQNVIIPAHDSIILTLNRGALDASIAIATYAANGIHDTDVVSVFQNVPLPVFSFGADTTIVNVKPGEPLSNFAFDLKNDGYAGFKITSIESTGDPRWSMDPADTSKLIKIGNWATISADFSGATEDGDYPLTFTINTQPCDGSLERTIIARIGETKSVSVNNAEVDGIIAFYSAQSSSIQVRAQTGAVITLSDILGRTIQSLTSDSEVSTLSAAGLASGSYIVMSDMKGQRRSRLVRVTQ